jgi:ribulose-phosphate 3-epimerase
MKLYLGIKSDPIEYRFSFSWLFRLMAEEGVSSLQLGSFFEAYHLSDEYFKKLRKQAEDFGVQIESLFTTHRELGGFFREDPEWAAVARRNYERLIEIGAILGARSVGSNPGAVPRDLMGLKVDGINRYLMHMKELMVFAKARGIDWLTVEPMSCLAEPPTLPNEIREMGKALADYHQMNPKMTARVGFCADIAHGYIDQVGKQKFSPVELFEATLPYLYEVHLKNTDSQFNSTFGFQPADLKKGIVDVAAFRDMLHARADEIPVNQLTGYLEVGGPKLGRDYTDFQLDEQLRNSLKYLKEVFLALPADTIQAEPLVGRILTPEISSPIQIASSMMCVDPLNFETAVRRVEALGVDLLHLDVMDGRFVPNMPLGLGILESLFKRTHLPLDVHLMVEDNDFFIERLKNSRVQQISVHVESCSQLDRTLVQIRKMEAKAGVALNPATPLHQLDFILERIDYVLLMTVNPGFAGQKLTPGSIRKIADCREYLDARGYEKVPIQVDGNVSFENIPDMVAAGAQCLVAGTSSIFHSGDSWPNNLRQIHEAIDNGFARRLQPVSL